MKFSTTLLFLFFLTTTLIAQDPWKGKPKGGWSKNATFLRIGGGYYGSTFTELGLTRMKIREGESLGLWANKSFYGSVEWRPSFLSKKSSDVIGLKVGTSQNFLLFSAGLEAKYLSDFEKGDVMITPIVGFNLMLVQLHYGYNISLNKSPFENIGHHQLSLVFQFNKNFFKPR